MNPFISHSIFKAEIKNLCSVRFEDKYVGGVYLGISQTAGHMPVFLSFLQKLSHLQKTVDFYYTISTGFLLTPDSF